MSGDAAKTQVLSYTTLGHRPWWIRQLLRPVGWPMWIVSVLACLAVLFAVSVPGTYFLILIFAPWVWLGLAVYWLLRLLIRFILMRLTKDPTLRFFERWWRWVIPPSLAAATVVLCALEVPLQVSFVLSRPAMERLVREVATTLGPYPDRRVGCFYTRGIEAIPGGGMQFFVREAGFLDRTGFAYLPPTATTRSRPSSGGTSYFEPFSGDWYTVREDW